MNQSKYIFALQGLSKNLVFSSAEGRKAGIPSRMLGYFCSKGHIERIGRGIYKIKDVNFGRDFQWEDLALTTLSIPNGVICLISALSYYGLTDEIMREFWIAVPHSTTSPIRDNVHIVRMRNMTLGKTTISLGNQRLKIFDRERTVIDAFRYLDKEIALKALQDYLKPSKEKKPDINKLLKYAKALRVNITLYISAFLL